MRHVLALFFLMSSAVAFAGSEENLFISSQKKQDALVLKVTNTDTLVLENGQRVKLIGLESIGLPPRHYVKYDEHGKPIEEARQEITIPLEEQAIVYAQDLVEDKKVKLEYDVDATDKNGYRYAYVYLSDGRMANVEILRMGFARLSLSPPNIKYADALRAAYLEAKTEKRGLQGQ